MEGKGPEGLEAGRLVTGRTQGTPFWLFSLFSFPGFGWFVFVFCDTWKNVLPFLIL